MFYYIIYNKKLLVFFALANIYQTLSQYTDQINSNRPGLSVGAFSVGKKVIQIESGFEYRNYKHKSYNNSKSVGKVSFLSLRYGFLKEQLEVIYDGIFMFDKFTNKNTVPNISYKRQGFLTNFIGFKYLFFDPFKKEKEINLYSWKANQFKIKDLIPAISLTLGTNISSEKNKYPLNDVFDIVYKPFLFSTTKIPVKKNSVISGKAILATQSHFLGTWVFVTNFIVNRILTEDIEKSYILTLTHTFDPKWSIFVENQGFISEIYNDNLFKFGGAYLFNNDLQFESSLGINTKNTPSSFIINFGASYRLDFHQDINPEILKEERELRKIDKKERKIQKKSDRENKKADRRARKKPKKND